MAKEVRSAEELVHRILSDPVTWQKVQESPATELLRLAREVGDDMPPSPPPPPLETDIVIYRLVVGVIGVVAVLAVIGAILVVALDVKDATPLLTALVSISSAAIGALAGLLSPVSFRRS
jgi:hypothetical protein